MNGTVVVTMTVAGDSHADCAVESSYNADRATADDTEVTACLDDENWDNGHCQSVCDGLCHA